ncbi:MAG: DUF1492 domain-containing protein [Oscillospiraceae bacterium]|nr:DUF1492 domain-containing protein [Oscillospiraceae bacterium]
MDIRKKLERARKIDREIWELRKAYSEAEQTKVYSSPSFGQAVQGTRGNAAENRAVTVLSLGEKIEEKKAELELLQAQLFDLIYTLPEDFTGERAILLAFYINRRRAADIAEEENMDVSGVYRKVRMAVKKLEQYCKEAS